MTTLTTYLLDKYAAFKGRDRLHALAVKNGVFRISLNSVISPKTSKGRVKKSAGGRDSKACAGNTCTPCEGAAPPSTPCRVAAQTAPTYGGAHGKK